MKLIIKIPCYNEAETLKIALDALPKHIDGIDVIEYLIINDGSSDNTVEVAKEWGVNYVVNFRNNKGLARGFMAGWTPAFAMALILLSIQMRIINIVEKILKN